MTGIDIPISELSISIHQPTIKEISQIGEEGFFIAIQYLTLNKYSYIQENNFPKDLTNFDIFMLILNDDRTKEHKNEILNFLILLFPNFQILFTPSSIILQKDKKTVLIDKDNFNLFQDILKSMFCLKSSLMNQNLGFNPKGKKAKEIADKIMKGRKKISEEKGEDKESIFSRYLSVLAVGNNKSIQELINLTVYQLYDLIERYNIFMNWDIDIRSRLAGAKAEKKPEDWMRNIH